jgi:hypothetical protein
MLAAPRRAFADLDDRNDLITLVRFAESRPHLDSFHVCHDRIHTRLEDLVDRANHIRREQGLAPFIPTKQESAFLDRRYWRAIQEYKVAAERKVGGPYFPHPDAVFQIAMHNCSVQLDYGRPGIGQEALFVLDAALFHDVVEEAVDAVLRARYTEPMSRSRNLKKLRSALGLSADERAYSIKLEKSAIRRRVAKGFRRQHGTKKSEEQCAIEDSLSRYNDQLLEDLHYFGDPIVDPDSFAHRATLALALLTREGNENYYRSIARMIRPHHKKRIPVEVIQDVIEVKLYDRTANMADMEIPGAVAVRHDPIKYADVIALWDEDTDLTPLRRARMIQSLRYRTFNLVSQPGFFFGDNRYEYSPAARLYQCYKSIALLNCVRLAELGDDNSLHVTYLPLAREVQKQSRVVMDHLCSRGYIPSRVHDSPGTLVLEEAWRVHTLHSEYAQRGGYHRVTRPGSHPFDGILTRFFDAPIRGRKMSLRVLDQQLTMALGVAVAFDHIPTMYIEDPTYFLDGLSTRGLKPRASLDSSTYVPKHLRDS